MLGSRGSREARTATGWVDQRDLGLTPFWTSERLCTGDARGLTERRWRLCMQGYRGVVALTRLADKGLCEGGVALNCGHVGERRRPWHDKRTRLE